MAEIKVTEVVARIVDILTPLSSEERKRVISASLTLLGAVSYTHLFLCARKLVAFVAQIQCVIRGIKASRRLTKGSRRLVVERWFSGR